MGNKKQKKQISTTERVYNAIVELHSKKGPLDINSTRNSLKHTKGIDSGAKFNAALEQLIQSGRISRDGHTISPATPKAEITTPISQPSANLVYGRVVKLSHDNLVFVPNDNSIVRGKVFLLNDKSTLPSFENKLCTLELTSNPYDDAPMGVVKDILGDAGNPIAEYDAIAQSHGAIMSWLDPAVQQEIKALPTSVNPNDYNLVDEQGILRVNNNATETIVDLRHLPFTSTDPKGCMDMDDVMYSTYDNVGNIVVYSAIADVTRYVKPNSEIGKRYIHGGFTFYASNRAYNILPPELSTGICSLHPNVPRLTFVIKTTIDATTGLPIESKFMNALVESKEKFSYGEAQHIVDTRPDITRTYLLQKTKAGHALSREELVVMNKYASDLISKGFSTRNSITFNTKNEYRPVFSEDGLHIVAMAPAERYPYDKVVENFMVTANEESAKFALQHNIPIIFRVHDEPNSKKIDQAYEFFSFLHIPFDGDLSPSGTRRIVESVKGTYKENVVNNFLVRMQSKAKYSISTDPKSVQFLGAKNSRNGNSFVSQRLQTVNRHARNHALQELIENIKEEEKMISHFGLQSEHYSHTTAPIRRITDYVTHYNIKAFLNHTPMLPMSVVREITEWANEREDAIIKAEREQHEFNSALYCEDRINEVMKGRISGFRSIVEGRISGAKDIMVIVENEETGVRVQIPAMELLTAKYSHFNDVKISTFGCGLVTKGGNRPLLTLCEEVTFKVAEASRVTRSVYASTNLVKDFTQTSFLAELQELSAITTDESQIRNPIHQRNLYEARLKGASEARPASKKVVTETSTRLSRDGVAGVIDATEAEEIARQATARYKANKNGYGSSKSNRQAYNADDYYFEQDLDSTDDDVM